MSETSSGVSRLELNRRLGRRVALGADQRRALVQHLAVSRRHAIDEIRRHLVAAIRERPVAGRETHRRDTARAECERQVVRHGRVVEAETLHVLDGGRNTHALQDANRYGVH